MVLKTLIDFCAKENAPKTRSAVSPLWDFFEKRKTKMRCAWLVPVPLSTLLLFFFFVTIED
jgi:hypothetical protein